MAEVLDLTLSSDDEAAKHQDKKPKIAPANESDDEVECLDENPFAPPAPVPQAAADSGDDEDVAITGSKGQNALQHFPHCRENCVVHLFAKDPTQHCSQCFCVVCDVPASRCAAWPAHCRLKYADPSTQRLRRDARAAALLQAAGGAPTAKTLTLGSYHTGELYQPDAATSMTALLRAVTQVWPVEAPAPPGLASGTSLRPYQRQSLAFMLDLENAPSDDRRLGFKTLWKQPNGALFRLRAGWLCDEVGMGKTMSIISLILARPRPANQLPTDAQWRTLQRRHPFISRVRGPDKTIRKYFAKAPGQPEKEIPAHEYYMGSDWGCTPVSKDGTRYYDRNVPNPNYATWRKAPALPGGAQTLTLKATVISCPVTLIGQWHDEITKWAPGLRVLVNHSSHDDRKELEKGRLNDSLRDYDVIICSPNTRLGGRSILQHPELRFHRLIVDEAHVTRGAADRFLSESETVRGGTKNEHLPRFDSCWLVTGTPFTTGLSQLKLGAESIAWWSPVHKLSHHGRALAEMHPTHWLICAQVGPPQTVRRRPEPAEVLQGLGAAPLGHDPPHEGPADPRRARARFTKDGYEDRAPRPPASGARRLRADPGDVRGAGAPARGRAQAAPPRDGFGTSAARLRRHAARGDAGRRF